MLESMSMGVPMVATDIGCAKEALIDGVTGYVVAPGRPEALAARLRLLSKDRDHRRSCGINARNLVESCFSRDKMVSNYLALTLDVSGRQERVEAQRVLANKEDAENEG
jgi:glycosyltransferase involved in cell wall biosynthesis